ncbi:DUF2796 domain-containing protein [Marinobacter nauticus]
MNPHQFSAFLLALTLGASATMSLAANNPDSHQHGHARLQMAIEGERIDLFLTSPAANLVGFEQAPATEAQREKVRTVRAWARQTPMVTSADRPCTVTDVSVHATWPHRGAKHTHENEGHADLEINQSLNCPGLSESTELETTLMAQFPLLKQVEVQWVGPQGQGGALLTSGQIRFRPAN